MSPICIDFETVELQPNGSTRASTEAYRENFRVSSCAVTYKVGEGLYKSEYYVGEQYIRMALAQLQGIPLIAHNIQFESMVSKCRFPELKLNWAYDTMRLVQVFDNGADKYEFVSLPSYDPLLEEPEKKESKSGLGLVKSLKRIFGESYEDHKNEAYQWIKENVPECKRGKEGQYLDRLPADILERYNVADTENTYRLYEYLTAHFRDINYDWTFDHQLYLSSVALIVDSKIRGVRVDREALAKYRLEIVQELKDIADAFHERMRDQIKLVERDRLVAYVRAPKTDKGRHKRLVKALHDPKVKAELAFNVGSNKQLEDLFVGKLGIVPKFFTDKKKPSFRSAVLHQWNEGGLLLQKRRKRGIVLAQVEALLELSEYDNLFHIDLKACGAASGRFAGGRH